MRKLIYIESDPRANDLETEIKKNTRINNFITFN